MHLRIELVNSDTFEVPLHYNHMLQGFIYRTIDEKMAVFLHNLGYGNTRKFKLFTFSRLMGTFDNESKRGRIVFKGNVFFELASPIDDFCESFANGLFKRNVNIGGYELDIAGITIERQRVIGSEAILETLSPVVAYSTLAKGDGSKYTCYFQPGERDFERIVVENLRKKYEAISGDRTEDELRIRCVTNPRMCVVEYKNIIIKGYMCKLKLSGSQRLIQVAVDAGLGSKNSMGFGCVRLAHKSRLRGFPAYRSL
jgi:CRISPR-associated endoribonuclease Cas6